MEKALPTTLQMSKTLTKVKKNTATLNKVIVLLKSWVKKLETNN